MSLSKEGELQRILALGEAFNYVNIIALILSIVLFLVISLTYVTDFSASKRLSYKLYLFIAIADILSHAPILIPYNFDMLACQIITLITLFSNFFSTFITACMAYNLMMIFLLDKPIYVKSCTFYVSCCTILSIILCIPITVMSFTYIDKCPYYLRYPFPIGKIVLFFSFGLWILLPTLFCFFIFITVIVKLNKYQSKTNHNTTINATHHFNLKRMVARLILYPTVPVITILPYIICMCLLGPDNKLSYAEYFLQYFCASTAGIFNFIFFLFDPALPSIYDEFRSRYVNKAVPNDDKVFVELEASFSVDTVDRKMLI